MKLRNKKTGEIVEYDKIGFRKGLSDGWKDFVPNAESITELNENWEDYVPKEPLIKDEKIRKAVRAWAEANSLNEIKYRSEDLGDRFNGFDFEYIKFNPWKADNLKDYKIYTIAELCGEEQE